MSDHGMNCPHHADKDEACTCALTERTMHAAWRKRAEEAETRISALEAQVKALTAERDAQAEAVRDIVAAIKNEPELPGLMPDEMWAMLNGNRDVTQLALVRAVQATKEGIIKNAKNNPIARAAVEGGKRES